MLYKLLRGAYSRYEDGERVVYDPKSKPVIELTPKQARALTDYYGSRVAPFIDPEEAVALRDEQKAAAAEEAAKTEDPGSESGVEDLNVQEAAEVIAQMDDTKALENLIDDEEERGNRKGVLNVAYARLDDLEAEAAADAQAAAKKEAEEEAEAAKAAKAKAKTK